MTMVCIACDPDEEEDLAAEGTLKVFVDGNFRTSTVAAATLNSSSGSEILDIAADLTVSGATTRITLTAYSPNTNGMISTGEYPFASETHPGPYKGVCFYFLNDGNAPFGTLYVPQSNVGRMTITEMDRAALVVSGTFEATVGRNGEEKSFTKGSFTKVKVTVN